jgi:hypothetical protein
MAGLEPGPGDAVGARRGRVIAAGGLLLPRRPKVQVILQQLPQYLPAPLVQEFFELAGSQPGRRRPGQLIGQGGEQIR